MIVSGSPAQYALFNCCAAELVSNDSMFPKSFLPSVIVTDPPYKISQGGRNGSIGSRCNGHKTMSGIFDGEIYDNDGEIVLTTLTWEEIAEMFYQALPDGGVVVSMCESRNYLPAMTALVGAGLKLNTVWYWDKRGHGSAGPVSKFGMKTTEGVLVYRKGKYVPLQPDYTGVGQIFTSPGFSKIAQHQTEKPVSLMREFIKAWTAPGDTVFDPFMGSGSTGVAALSCGRRFIGCEIDRKWFDIADNRISGVACCGADTSSSVQGDMFDA